MQTSSQRPMVAIIGRPNVGKSSIFNRLAGRRISIVHEEPGVTRDRIICTVRCYDKIFDLVDTAGLVPPGVGLEDTKIADKSIDGAVRRQVRTALSEAAAVIFVVDIQKGIIPADEKAAAMLYKSGMPVFLAANKADQAALDTHVHDFDKLGFPVFPVSALHNRGLDDLIEKICANLPAGKDEEPPQIKAAVVGRPNVGKSSLINRLLKSERLIVSGEPGTTRDSIAAPLNAKIGSQILKYVLIDTAGLRRRKTIKHPVDGLGQLRARESIASADVVALVLDAAQGPTAHDKNIAAGILAAEKGILLVVNKWDLISSASQSSYLAALYRELPFLDFVPAVCVSALSGFNARILIDAMHYVAEQTRTKISTGMLNQAFKTALDRFQPPFVKGGRFKIFYATQIKIQPITFLIFVNDPAKVSQGYEKYLKSSLRKTFGLEGVPIVLKYKKRGVKK